MGKINGITIGCKGILELQPTLLTRLDDSLSGEIVAFGAALSAQGIAWRGEANGYGDLLSHRL
jgi:hypothetical protein